MAKPEYLCGVALLSLAVTTAVLWGLDVQYWGFSSEQDLVFGVPKFADPAALGSLLVINSSQPQDEWSTVSVPNKEASCTPDEPTAPSYTDAFLHAWSSRDGATVPVAA